jgi:tetratricopeptide (TPR) repeat protein
MHFFPRYKNLWRGFFVIFAGMKRPVVIGLFLLLALTACHHKGPEPVEGPTQMDLASPELSAIDSLMWQRPDSALMRLIPCFDTCRDGVHTVSTDYNRHYANLLLAELLYKNDYAQTNRAELQQAVPYFDSLVRQTTPPTSLRAKRGNPREPGGLKHTPQPPNTSIYPFLSARAHYINGVGHYEQGQVAEACAEYLKALEVMESHFEEKELVGKKAKFMAYTYNRLADMFSAQFMMEPAIACYEQSLVYNRIAPTSPFGVSNTLLRLGIQYDKLGQKEKAMEYYEQALEALPAMGGPRYWDIIASKVFCDYQLGSGMEQPLNTLRQVLAQAESEKEVTGRCLPIGYIFFEEGVYDSALVYLEPVFEHDENLTRRIQAADFLRIIYDSMGQKDKAGECMRFLATHKKSEGENKALVSQLEGLFQDYLNQKQEQKAAQEKREAVRKTVRILVPIALAVAAVVVLVVRKRGKKRLATQEQTHRMEQAEIKASLLRFMEQNKELTKENEVVSQQAQQALRRRVMELYHSKEENKWERILAEFSATYPHAMEKLQSAYPEMTESERNIAILSFLGFRTKEEADILNLSLYTVEKYRTNVKKKANPDLFSNLFK